MVASFIYIILIVKRQDNMNFGQALDAFREGAFLSRSSWTGKDVYFKDGTFVIRQDKEDSENQWIPIAEDMMAEDWTVMIYGENE